MKELILERKRFDYICDLTKDLDEYTKSESIFNNYIYNKKIDGYWIIRFPGASRGRIIVDENEIITNIELYKNDNLYISEAEQLLRRKYIGYKIIIEGEK